MKDAKKVFYFLTTLDAVGACWDSRVAFNILFNIFGIGLHMEVLAAAWGGITASKAL